MNHTVNRLESDQKYPLLPTSDTREVINQGKVKRSKDLTSELMELNNQLPWITQRDLDLGSHEFHEKFMEWLQARGHRDDKSLHISDVSGEWMSDDELFERIREQWQLSIETRHLFPPDASSSPRRSAERYRVPDVPILPQNVSALSEDPEEHAEALSRSLFSESK